MIETLRRLLGQFGDVARTSTACSLLYGWCEYFGGRYSLAESWLETALDVAPAGLDRTMLTSLSLNISLARGDVAAALDVGRQMTETNQLVSHPSDLATATGAAYAWAGQADDACSTLGFATEKASAEHHHPAHLLALVFLTIVEFENAATAPARTAASVAIETAEQIGLGEYYGITGVTAVQEGCRREETASYRRLQPRRPAPPPAGSRAGDPADLPRNLGDRSDAWDRPCLHVAHPTRAVRAADHPRPRSLR